MSGNDTGRRMQLCTHLHTSSATASASWHGFACAIVEGLRARGLTLAVEEVVSIRTDDFPTRARRPHNSRLDLSRLHQVFGLTPATWQSVLAAELDELAGELSAAS